MRFYYTLALVISGLAVFAQPKILHYTETSGFDHGTRGVSLQMFQNIALSEGYLVDDDQTGDSFNSLSNLQEYDVVVFSNTSGDNILNATQRANFEAYIAGGGSFLGIHAATDTYRHSSANGSNTGTWDFYAELVGASVQQSPNHVSGTPQYELNHIGTHNSTINLPNPWLKNEEYYYWENGFFGSNNNTVLEVEETIGPNNMVNSYDAPRPMSWHRELEQGGQMFYTALGHASSNFTSDQNFINHIKNAILSIVNVPTSLEQELQKEQVSLTVSNSELELLLDNQRPQNLVLRNILGQPVLSGRNTSVLNVKKLPTGLYLLEASSSEFTVLRKIYLN